LIPLRQYNCHGSRLFNCRRRGHYSARRKSKEAEDFQRSFGLTPPHKIDATILARNKVARKDPFRRIDIENSVD
jgi:hypothetical protein